MDEEREYGFIRLELWPVEGEKGALSYKARYTFVDATGEHVYDKDFPTLMASVVESFNVMVDAARKTAIKLGEPVPPAPTEESVGD